MNIQQSANTTDHQQHGDVFADFDAITQGLLGNPVAEHRTPLNIASTGNNRNQHPHGGGFVHQSQHPDKQRYL